MYIYPISFLGFPEINLLAKKLRTAISLAISLICCSPLAVSIELSIINTDNNGCRGQPLLTA